MGEEIAKKPSWEERQALATKRIQEAMGEHTPEAYLEAASNSEAEVNEYFDLQDWFTSAFDAAALTVGGGTDVEITAAARTAVKKAEPEKFARLRELERLLHLNNVRSQHLSSGAHASIVEANLRSKHVYDA